MKNKYLGKFSPEGKPEGFLLEGVNYKTAAQKEEKLAEGYVEITEEDWLYYTNNKGTGDNGTGYIRDPETGKPVSAPAKVYSKTELANMAEAACEGAVNELNNQIILAQSDGDTELVAELQEEKEEVLAKYRDQLAKIENGEITDPSQLQD
jgi:hypothetical protein